MDTIGGTNTYKCGSAEEFVTFINKKENMEHYLLSNLVYKLIQIGKVPAAQQCYSFIISPALGGKIIAENIECMDAAVCISIAGQLHKQISDLPFGTVIDKLIISDE